MDKKIKLLLVRVVVTFFEAGGAVWAASGFKLDKVVLGGVVGAGLSAVYNALRSRWPEVFSLGVSK